jgi:hypothetical protein
VDIVADYLGPGDELGLLADALCVITRAADGGDLDAQRFIARIAHFHADAHATDLVEAEGNSRAWA